MRNSPSSLHSRPQQAHNPTHKAARHLLSVSVFQLHVEDAMTGRYSGSNCPSTCPQKACLQAADSDGLSCPKMFSIVSGSLHRHKLHKQQQELDQEQPKHHHGHHGHHEGSTAAVSQSRSVSPSAYATQLQSGPPPGYPTQGREQGGSAQSGTKVTTYVSLQLCAAVPASEDSRQACLRAPARASAAGLKSVHAVSGWSAS